MMKKFKSYDEMIRFYGICMDKEDYEYEKKMIEKFVGDDEYEIVEDVVYRSYDCIKKGDKFYWIDDRYEELRFDECNEEEMEIIKREYDLD